MSPEKRAESDGYARSLVEASLDPMVVVDPEGRIMDVNRALEKVTETSREELIGSDVFQIFTEPDEAREGARLVFTEGYLRDFPLVIRGASGNLTEVIWNASVLRDPEGKIEGALGAARDVTETRKAEAAMARLSRQNQMILNSAGEGIYGTDALGNITFVNPAAAHMLGYRVDELLGKNSHETFHHSKPDGSPYPLEECRLHISLLSGEQTESKDEVFWTRQGTPINVEYINTPMAESGYYIAGAVVIFRDITERLRDEEALRLSEARFRSYIELTGQLVWTTNAAGEVEEDIPLWRRFSGQSYEEAKGWGWSNALHPDDAELAVEAWRTAVEKKSEYETEYRVRRYDGVYRYFMARGVPVLDENGAIREWVGTCIDITAQKQAQAQIDEQRSREMDRLAELERFQKLTVGRELKMVELKKEIEELRRRLGEAA